MRIRTWSTIFVVSSVLSINAGCTQSDTEDSVAQTDATAADDASQPEPPESEGTETVTARRVVQEAEEALDAAGDLAAQTKEEYVREFDEQLADLDEQMEEMNQRAETLTEQAAAEWEATWTDLQENRRTLQERFDELRSASGDAWLDLRDGTDVAWDELQQAFDEASEHFEDVGDASQPADNESQPQ